MDNYRIVNENELFHSGIKGMKWGVRRYQNEDGTYTEEGKKRYYKKTNFDYYNDYKNSKNRDIQKYYCREALNELADEQHTARTEEEKYRTLYKMTGNYKYSDIADKYEEKADILGDRFEEIVEEEKKWLAVNEPTTSIYSLDNYAPVKVPKISLLKLPPIVSIPALVVSKVLFGSKKVYVKNHFWSEWHL